MKEPVRHLDIALGGAVSLSILILLVGLKIPLTELLICLYLNIGLFLCLVLLLRKKASSIATAPLLFSLFSLISYPPSEYALSLLLDWGEYTAPSPRILGTPTYMLGCWVYLAFVLAYLYTRLLSVVRHVFASSVLIGVIALSSSLIFENWGNMVGLWTNNSGGPMVGTVPLYVVLGYAFVFSFIGRLLKHPVWGGLLSSPLICSTWFVLSCFLTLDSTGGRVG